MKTIGIIGGLSWFSTSVYYKTINQLTNQRLGGLHSARLLIHSMDFEEFNSLLQENKWDEIEKSITIIAEQLRNAGADCLVIATNTAHLVADKVRQNIDIPLLHIAEETAKEIISIQLNKVLLLGTKFTMENNFFKNKLLEFGIETIIPNDIDRAFINQSIFNELTKGNFNEETKKRYISIIDKVKTESVQGVIFGCTEIALLITQEDTDLQIFDTSFIHSKSAVDFSLSDKKK